MESLAINYAGGQQLFQLQNNLLLLYTIHMQWA